MKPSPTACGLLWGAVMALITLPSTQGENTPFGDIYLEQVYVNKSVAERLESGTNAHKENFLLACSTPSLASRTMLRDITLRKTIIFKEHLDVKMHLSPADDMECELREMLTSVEQQVLSHGRCTYSYARFLAAGDHSVDCQLSGGSSFKLKMVCSKGCPKAPNANPEPFCKGTTTLPPANYGIVNSFGDGSPSFGLYAPNSTCNWRIPKSVRGVTNFLFTRFDMGQGDTVTVSWSADGITKHHIRTYGVGSIPESVGTDAPFMHIEFQSDGSNQGLGFYGFYYDTHEFHDPVLVVAEKVDQIGDPADIQKGTGLEARHADKGGFTTRLPREAANIEPPTGTFTGVLPVPDVHIAGDKKGKTDKRAPEPQSVPGGPVSERKKHNKRNHN